MELKTLIFLIVLVYDLRRVNSQEPCILDLNDRNISPIFPPFVYTLEGELFIPTNNKIRLSNAKSALLSCHENFFRKFPNLHNITVTCNDDTLMVDNNSEKFKHLSCDLKIIEEVKGTVAGCPTTHQGIYYEYYNTFKSSHIKLAEVCYDYQNDVNFFTRILASKNVDVDLKFQHEKSLPANDNIRHTVETLKAYRADNMKRRLQTILSEESEIAEEPLLQVKLLSTIFFNEQFRDVAKFSTNNVGVWKTVAHGNWQRIIDGVKKYYENKSGVVEIIFGTRGVLSLSNPSGNAVEIHLRENKTPVPLYLWTVVHDVSTGKAVAVVTINNPFLSTKNIKELVFCKNECEQISWLHELLKNQNYDRIVYGYTFCCSVKDFGLYSQISTTSKLLTE